MKLRLFKSMYYLPVFLAFPLQSYPNISQSYKRGMAIYQASFFHIEQLLRMLNLVSELLSLKKLIQLCLISHLLFQK